MITDDQARMQQLREQAKARRSQISEPAGELSRVELQYLVHDDQVHHIELELRNEELRNARLEKQEAENQLTPARDRNARLFDGAPVGVRRDA